MTGAEPTAAPPARRGRAGSRRIELAVIMVTELVGPDVSRSRHGGTRFDALRRELDWTLRDASEDVGGRVVKRTSDGLLIAFPSGSAALEAAVAIQQQIARRNRGAETAIGARIGVSMGDAVFEDGDYFGLPPIEATRLCAEARDGEILIADPVRAVLADRRSHRLEPAGPRRLKGLPDPVIAWRALCPAPSDAPGPPLPPRLGGAPFGPYVGRAGERARLLERWERAAGGERQVVLVTGEAGVGKTRLVSHVAQSGLPDHALILYGRCDEDQGMPYQPWRELLRDYAQVAPRGLLRPYASELARLVPGLSHRLGPVPAAPAGDPDSDRYVLFEAVASLLGAASERAPVLVVLDDLHWADRPTLLLLKHLIAAGPPGRLMLLGTYRGSDIAADHPVSALAADLRRERGATRIDLVGLGQDDIVALVEDLAGHPADAAGRALAREVHRETAGNPFFVGELLRHLRETGVIDERIDGRWSLRSPLAAADPPQSVREVITRRVRRLGADARRLLDVAAVIGCEFDVPLLAAAAEIPVPEVLDLLDEAGAAALLTTAVVTRPALSGLDLAEIHAFSHGLVQATLYADLPAGRRVRLHQAVGRAIEAGCAGPEEVDGRLVELAHHFLAAAPAGERARAVAYATRAGDQAMAQSAYDQAAGLFARALALPGTEPGPARIGLLQALGSARMRAGDSEGARRALLEAAAAARNQAEPEALARAVRACEIWGLSLGVDHVLVGLAEEAIGLLEAWGRPRLAAEVKGLLAAALYYAPAGETPRRERLAREALASARDGYEAGDHDSTATLAYVLSRCLLARWGPDSATRDFPLADELVELSRALGDVELELFALNWRNTMLGELGEFAALERELERMEHMATVLRQPRAIVFLPLHRAMLALAAGRFAEAERLNAESVAIGERIAGSVGRLAAEVQLMMVRLQQGRLPELEAEVRAVVDRHPDLVVFRCALVILLLQADRAAEARAEFERVLAPGLAGLRRDHTQILALALLADAAVELDDRPGARSLYDRLLPYRRRWVVVANDTALWPVDRSLGRLAGVGGAVARAESHLAAARHQADRAGAAPSLALIALDEARLLATGDVVRAAERAGQARRVAATLGMGRLERAAARLEDELVAGGAA